MHTRRRRTARQSSNVFKAFTQPQILELKEVFNLLDSTADGNISREDLVVFLDTIGAPLTNEEIDSMIDDMGDRFNFTLFLTTLCERLSNLDSENVIAAALAKIDGNERQDISVQELKNALTAREEGVTEEEWRTLEKQLVPVKGRVMIKEVAKMIRHCGLSPEDCSASTRNKEE